MRAKNKIWLLDGATGSELIARGLKPDPIVWTANAGETHFEILKTIHREYLEAGADIVTANTFRSNPHAFKKLGKTEADAKRSLFANIRAAREAVNDFGSGLVAGSIAPLEDCYKVALVPDDKTLEREHRWIAENLKASGCDIALLETMGTEREALTALRAAKAAGFKDVWASFLVDGTGLKLLGGEDLHSVAAKCVAAGASAVLVNCVHYEVAEKSLSLLTKLSEGLAQVGAYCNSARMKIEDGEAKWEAGNDSAEDQAREYAKVSSEWPKRFNATIFGGCCGMSALHIEKLRKALL